MTWRDCVGVEGFEVSDAGEVRNKASGRLLSQYSAGAGYRRVHAYEGGKRRQLYVHGLVAEAFLGPRNGREVNHKNGAKSDNSVGNLGWVTRGENERHSRDVLGRLCVPVVATEIATGKRTTYPSAAAAAKLGGFDAKMVSLCRTGKKKTHKGHRFSYVAADEASK